jgi:hypothetical protein
LERELVERMPNLELAVSDRLSIQRDMTAEPTGALRRPEADPRTRSGRRGSSASMILAAAPMS